MIDEGRRAISDPDHLDELEGLRAVLEVTSCTPAEGVARGLGLLDASFDRAVVQASLACALGLPLLGRADEAELAVDAGVRAYTRLGGQLTLYEPSLLYVAKALAQAIVGRLEEAEDTAVTGYEQALVADDAAGWAFFAQARGVVALERGLLDDAIRWWNEAAGLFRAVNHGGPLGWSLLGLTLAHAMRGEVEPAAAALPGGGRAQPSRRLPRRQPSAGPGVAGGGQGTAGRGPRRARGRDRRWPRSGASGRTR